MSDLIVIDPQLLTDTGAPLKRRFKDNGDGTWSEQVSAGGVSLAGYVGTPVAPSAPSPVAAVGAMGQYLASLPTDLNDTEMAPLAIDIKRRLIVVGNVAAGATDSGNPVKTGGVGRTANPTAVTNGQRVDATFDKLGKQVVVGSLRDLKADAPLTITSSTAETTLIAAIASTFNDLYGVVATNTSATAVEAVFRDTTAGTPRFSINIPAGETRGFMLPESAAYKQATVNTNWTVQCGTSVASVKINALYVKNI